jgi:general nucleoside transport system permease protein
VSWIVTNAFFFAVVLQTTPILLAALGGMFSQQANVLNVALDGMMLMGAFASISIGALTHNAFIAVIAAAVTGLVIALVFGLLTLYLGADLLITGIGLVILTGGLTVLLLSTIYHTAGSYSPSHFPGLWAIHLGPFAHVPVIGPAFDGQSVLTLLTVLLIPASAFMLYRTRFGVHVRAVGEDASAATAAGLDAKRIKLATIAISGVLSGIAGAALAMATLGQFLTGMTAGRGFIALAAIFAGGATPVGTTIACLVFGLAGAAANELQLQNVPSDLILMLPYIVTVMVLVLRPVGRTLVSRWRETRQLRLLPVP